MIHSQLTAPSPVISPIAVEDSPALAEVTGPARSEFPSANLKRFLDQRAPAFAQLIAESGMTPADRLLALYHGKWNGDVTRVYEEFAY